MDKVEIRNPSGGKRKKFSYSKKYKKCEYCGKEFEVKSPTHKFCSINCLNMNIKKLANVRCIDCGALICKYKAKRCVNCSGKGELSSNWKGGISSILYSVGRKNMTEMEMFAGKCKCGKRLSMRILDVREDENDKKSKIVAWIIHGSCKKCKIVYAQGIFEGETKPIEDRDFIIEWDKKIKGTKHIKELK